MPRPGIMLAAALVVVGFAATPSADGDASKRARRSARPAITDLHIGDDGVVVTSENEQSVVIGFRLTSKHAATVRVRFEVGVDRNGNGHVDDDEYFAPTVYFPPGGGKSALPRRRRSAIVARLRATPEGVDHLLAWNVRSNLSRGQFLGTRRIPRRSRPDDFEIVPQARPVLRLTAARAEPVSRAISYDGDAATTISFDAVEPGPSLQLVGTASDADSEDLNGNNRLDVPDGEDRDGDGALRAVRLDVLAWWVRVPEGFDPSALDPDALLRLDWLPCSLDLDLGPVAPVRNNATPGGHRISFLWDTARDVAGLHGPFLLGMRAWDPYGGFSDFQVLAQPVTIGP